MWQPKGVKHGIFCQLLYTNVKIFDLWMLSPTEKVCKNNKNIFQIFRNSKFSKNKDFLVCTQINPWPRFTYVTEGISKTSVSLVLSPQCPLWFAFSVIPESSETDPHLQSQLSIDKNKQIIWDRTAAHLNRLKLRWKSHHTVWNEYNL